MFSTTYPIMPRDQAPTIRPTFLMGPVSSRAVRSPLFGDNSLVYYKPASNSSVGLGSVGTVRNSRTTSKRI